MTLATLSGWINQNRIGVFVASLLCLGLASCGVQFSPPEAPIQNIRWSDGDSGVINGERFRLVDVDAPETGPVGTDNGARCERERALGRASKAFMEASTQDAELSMRIYESDRYGRLVIGLDADGVSVVDTAIAAGHLKDWSHQNGRAMTAKPDWCRS